MMCGKSHLFLPRLRLEERFVIGHFTFVICYLKQQQTSGLVNLNSIATNLYQLERPSYLVFK